MAVFPIDSVFPNTIAPVSYPSSQQSSQTREDEFSISKTADSKATDSETNESETNAKSENSESNPQELTRQEQQQVQKLAQRDREVRAHEAAHKAAGGSLTGPATFEYEAGPNGRRYAVGGEVSIDTSKVPNDPQATVIKANKVRAAALAPANPSGQDLSIASQATTMAAEARAQLIKEQSNQEISGDGSTATNGTSTKETDAYQQTSQLSPDDSQRSSIKLIA